MSGTDKTKPQADLAGPLVILVEPQLGENIGMAARAMGNFGLTRLRIVNPRDGWPNVHARRAASGADHILDQVELFDTVEQAVADCTLLFATTARAHDQAKPVVAPEEAAQEMSSQIAVGAVKQAEQTDTRIGKLSRGLERVFEDVLKEGVRRGEFRSDLDTRLAVLGMLGMANAVANWYRAEEVAIDRISAEFARLLVGGVAKRPKPRRGSIARRRPTR